VRYDKKPPYLLLTNPLRRSTSRSDSFGGTSQSIKDLEEEYNEKQMELEAIANYISLFLGFEFVAYVLL
jgi:hypothetical protein